MALKSRICSPVTVFLGVWLWVGFVLAPLPVRRADAQAQERRVPPQAELRLSYAPLVKRVAPAVVNVYAAKVVQNRNPLFDDPIFRHFFGMPGGRRHAECSARSAPA